MRRVFGKIGLLAALGSGCGSNVVSFSTTREPPTPFDGSASTDAAIAAADAGADMPVDVPTPPELPLKCEGATADLTLVLPCAVGMSPLNATECYLSGAVDPRQPAVNFLAPLGELAHLINQPLDLSDYIVVAPARVLVGAKGFTMKTIRGTAVFFRVDPVERSFAGWLNSLSIVWTTDDGDTLSCAATDSPIWAVPGNFF